MASRINEAFAQRKRIAHVPQKGSPAKAVATPSVSKADARVGKDHATLKQFDLTWEYGPCIGISRIDRWERAERHGLNPPAEVKDLINSHATDPAYTECLWNDYTTLR